MKIKTSELSGPALDWAVAQALGEAVFLRHSFLRERYKFLCSVGRAGLAESLEFHLAHQDNDAIIGAILTGSTSPVPNYSTNWAQGGPIIERERISIRQWTNVPIVHAYMPQDDAPWASDGTSPLIAALRCFVASRLGDEADVPEELA